MNYFLNCSESTTKSSLNTSPSLIEMLNTPFKLKKTISSISTKKESESSSTVEDLTEVSFEITTVTKLTNKQYYQK